MRQQVVYATYERGCVPIKLYLREIRISHHFHTLQNCFCCFCQPFKNAKTSVTAWLIQKRAVVGVQLTSCKTPDRYLLLVMTPGAGC